MSPAERDVTIITPCRDVPRLISAHLNCIRSFYPDVCIITLDGGRGDSRCSSYLDSRKDIRRFGVAPVSDETSPCSVIGEGLDQIFSAGLVETPYWAMFHADVWIKASGAVEFLHGLVQGAVAAGFDYYGRYVLPAYSIYDTRATVQDMGRVSMGTVHRPAKELKHIHECLGKMLSNSLLERGVPLADSGAVSHVIGSNDELKAYIANGIAFLSSFYEPTEALVQLWIKEGRPIHYAPMSIMNTYFGHAWGRGHGDKLDQVPDEMEEWADA